MKIAAVLIADEQHPTELQEWLDANPSITIHFVTIEHDIFYVFYS